MSGSRPSVGKRQRELQKLEKAQSKAARKAVRQVITADASDGLMLPSESELTDQLAALHHAFEAGEISPDEFEDTQGRIRAQFERLYR